MGAAEVWNGERTVEADRCPGDPTTPATRIIQFQFLFWVPLLDTTSERKNG